MELEEVDLQRILNLVDKSKDEYVAILFHSTRCPFSQKFRPKVDILSKLFPAIRHFAFENSVIRGRLSDYGIQCFPTLVLLNSTMKARYHGPRTVSSLVRFYSEVAGVKPALVRYLPNANKDIIKKECPFSWSRAPEKMLGQDIYEVYVRGLCYWQDNED